MADLTVTAAKVGAIYPDKAEIVDMIAGATLTAGQAVFQDSAGKAQLAAASASSALQFRGIALTAANAGQGVSILKKGHVAGFTVSQAYDAALYLSINQGAISSGSPVAANSGSSCQVGRVVPLPDKSLTKVVYIDADWLRAWS